MKKLMGKQLSDREAKGLFTALIFLSVIGIGTTLYLLYLKFSPSASDVCNLGAAFNCDIVNKSVYSELFGIPVALLGLLSYIFFLKVSVALRFGIKKWIVPVPAQRTLIRLAFYFAALGLLFSLYLTYIEAFVLMTYCLFCLISQALILIIFILLLILVVKT